VASTASRHVYALSDPSEDASRLEASVPILKSIFVGTPQIAVFGFEIVCKKAQMTRQRQAAHA